MDAVYEFLLSKGINKFNIKQQLPKFSCNEIYDIVEEINELLSNVPKHKSSKIGTSNKFSFTANKQLSGDAYPCYDISCRTNNVNNLIKFTTLYADKVVIENYFNKYNSRNLSEHTLYDFIIGDLTILYHIRPLIDAGYLEIAQPGTRFCQDCYNKYVLPSKKIGENLNEIKGYIEETILNDIEVTFQSYPDFDSYHISSKGTDFIPHPYYSLHYKDNKNNSNTSFKNNFVHLDKEQIIKTGILQNTTSLLMHDIYSQGWIGQFYNTSYITNRQIDFDILSVINSNENNTRNSLIMKNLQHHIPVINTYNIESLIELRKNEEESFLIYRDSLLKVLNEHSYKTENEVREAFSDIIEPELMKINRTVTNFHRLAKNELITKAAISTVILEIGLFTSLITPTIFDTIMAFGGLACVAAPIKKALEITEEPEEIKNNDLYFLWKAGRIINK